jgi:hypothetical protein
MKALVLIGTYPMEVGYKILRVYTTNEKTLAEKDLNMIYEADPCGRKWELVECEFVSDL